MLEFAHFVELAFLPCIAAGVALGIAWRHVASAGQRTALQVAAALLFFVPQPFVLYLGSYSPRLHLYQQTLLSIWGFGVAALVIAGMLAPQSRFMRGLRGRSPKAGPVTRGAVALVMAVLGAYCARNVVGDYIFDRERLAGRIEGMRVVHHRRSPDTYQVLIARRAHDIPLDLAVELRVGDDVEAEVGAASDTILAIHKRP